MTVKAVSYTHLDVYKRQQLGIDGFKINYHEDKTKVQKLISELKRLRNEKSVLEVMNYVFENKILTKPIRLEEFQNDIQKEELEGSQINRKQFYNELMGVRYSEYILINDYIENHTPYSTKHGVKGAEYKNVLVVIDDNSWNQYRFNDVFSANKSNQSRFDRTLNSGSYTHLDVYKRQIQNKELLNCS